jgi:hypothetical protein
VGLVGRQYGGADFFAAMKSHRFRYLERKSDGRGCREAWAPPSHSTPVTYWGRGNRRYSAAGHAARAACFEIPALRLALAFRRACCARV